MLPVYSVTYLAGSYLLIFSPASGETRVRAQAVENVFFNSLLLLFG
jgi:hypothetical protein